MPRISPILTRQSLGGVATLVSGRVPLSAPVFCLYQDQALRDEVVAALHRNGIGVFAVRNMIGVGDCAETERSIAVAVNRMANVARVAPGAGLMADCLLYPSEEWMLANPHEGFITADRRILVLGQCGQSDRREYVSVPGSTLADVKGATLNGEDPAVLYGRRRVSPFSITFAREACRSVRKLRDALRERGIEDRLRGFFIGCYVHGEWNLNMFAPDHGRTAMRGFREYLRGKYGTDEALRAAWSDPFAAIRTALPPREHPRMALPPMIPASPRQADYRAAEARALAEQFITIARGIKKLSPRFVTGGFFPGANPPQTDWLRAAKDPAVDFLATPIAYENRGPGCGVGSQSPFCDAFSALGKVWFDELDTRTLVADRAVNGRYGRAATVAGSVDLLWRDAGQMLIRGHHGWWLDFGNNGKPPHSWHLKPGILAFHRRFAEVWRNVRQLDRRPLGEIKVFIPSTSARNYQILHYARTAVDIQRHVEWPFLGAPVEFDVLGNLLDGRSEPGRLNIIHGAMCLSREQMAGLTQRLRCRGVFVLWMGGAGLFEEGGCFDETRAECVIPIKQNFSLLDEPMELEASPTSEAAEWMGVSPRARFGQYDRNLTSGFVRRLSDLNVPMARIAMRWKLAVTDADAMPLARTADGSVAVAIMKDSHGTTHVVYNLPVLNTSFLRAVAQKAGCHLFTRVDDVVYASKGLLLLHAAYTGTHRVFFPRRTCLLDLRTGGRVLAPDAHLTLSLNRGETRLYDWSAPAHV